MHQIVDDARLAFRNLRRRGALPLIVVVTLAVGIACTTAMFSVVRGMLLRPLPWPDSERLAVIWNLPPGSADRLQLSHVEIADLQELLENVEVGSYAIRDTPLRLGTSDETFQVTYVSTQVFSMLGASPRLGRTFHADEYVFGGPPTAILSHETWQSVFGGASDVLGKTVVVRGQAREIVGVMPPEFPLPLDYATGERTQLWIGSDLGYAEGWPRQTRMFPALARLAEGTSLDQARAELDLALAELRRRHPDVYDAGWKMQLVPIGEEILGGVRPALTALFGAVFFVLMIACANVANLLLAQNDARQGEIAVRQALGAGRSRLVRQLMIENLALALLGGVLGAAGAFLAVDVLLALQPGNLPRIDTVTVDGTVLLFGLGVSLLTPMVFGLLPVTRAAGRDLRSALQRERGSSGGLRGLGGRRLLVVFEIALAAVLLAGAGLLIETLRNLARADLGFEPRGLTVAAVSGPYGSDLEAEDRVRFWDRLRQSASEPSGVEAVSLIRSVPLWGSVMSRAVEVEESTGAPIELPRVTLERAAPGIARAMGYRVLRGRDLTDEDRVDTTPVVMVNETLAAYLGENAVGRRVRITDRPEVWLTVVGVVGDIVSESIDQPAAPRLILPYTQFQATGRRVQSLMWLALRTADDAGLGPEAIRRLVAEVDSQASVVHVLSMEEQVAASALSRYRFAAFVLGLFAAVAVVLAVVGIYGLLAYVVHRGRREVGVRMAVGARRQDIYRLVNRQGLILALAGLALGVPCAFAMTGFLESLLYGVTPTEPRAFVATAVVLLTATLGAGLVPARRATEVDPIEVLRSE